MERRLAAILAADVVGYSRLIGANEASTLAALRSLRKDLVEPTLKRHRGRVVKLMGDGLLAEFASVVDAVAAAVEIQEAVPERSTHLPEDRRIALRIGVNTGDIVVEDGDIFGDGVNIAARLQEISDPNGVAISDGAHRELSGRLDLPFEDAGEKSLKNIKQPVRTWLWSPARKPDDASSSNTDPVLPDKPSIAVLPFDNLSDDPEQAYFADGMAEDIITSLSRYRSLFVIARNSTFAYKGQSPDLRDVSRDLGVRYVLEGSVRKGGTRIRVTAQLIEGGTGNHIWAERYDRELDDIFALQDEITATIVSAIGPEIDQVERDRAQRLPPENLNAWELYQRGLWHLYRFNREDNAEAWRLFGGARDASSNFAPALSGLTHAMYFAFMHGHAEDRSTLLQRAYETGRAAVVTDERDADAHFALGRILYLRHDLDASTAEFEVAISQNPNFAHAHMGLGTALVFGGHFIRCLESCDQALRLSPKDPLQWTIQTVKGLAFVCMGRNEEAVDALQQGTRQPTAAWTTYCLLASALGHLDDSSRTQAAVDHTLRVKPDLNATHLREIFPFRDPAHFEILIEGLKKAGLKI